MGFDRTPVVFTSGDVSGSEDGLLPQNKPHGV